MKVALVLFGDLRISPFYKKYAEILKDRKINFDIILWNRIKNEKNNEIGKNIFEYIGYTTNNKFKKIKHLINYKKFVIRKIKENKYDKLIILTTLNAFLIKNFLLRKYKYNYIFDYRDITYEGIKFYKKAVKKIIQYSYCTAISSLGFQEVLGKFENMVLAHNFNYFDIDNMIKYKKFEYKNKLNIVYIGMIREYEMCKRMIELFGNDIRFNLIINGDGDYYEQVKMLANNYSNVVITGKYVRNDKPKLLENADLLAYFYPLNFVNKYAIANKFYDGIIYKIPTIGNIQTFSGKEITNNNLGFSINLNDDNETIKDEVINYYNSIDSELFNNSSNKYLKKVLADDAIYLSKIKKFLE